MGGVWPVRLRPRYRLSPEREQKLRRVVALEWLTIFFMATIILVMYLTMGASQAMKAALIEDCLSLIPPVAFLLANRIRQRAPTPEFPYGFSRATLLAFLAASVAILMLGCFILYDAGHTLISREHPTIGHFHLLGTQWDIWAGWVMIGALIYSLVPPLILGRKKLPLAADLHDSTLYADATMNKADWMTAAAAIFGVLGIGLGWWWADAVAAGVIGLDVLHDGYRNVRRAMDDLMDHRPADVVTGEPLGLERIVEERLGRWPQVEQVNVRLREEGYLVAGEVFVVFRPGTDFDVSVERLTAFALTLDWRLHDLVVMPVSSLKALTPGTKGVQ